MQGASNQDAGEGEYLDGCVNPFTEGLIVVQLLGQTRGYPLTRLRAELDDLAPDWIDESIASLERAGVVTLKRTRLHMTAATRRLDALDLICI
jgi:hypothetical protein